MSKKIAAYIAGDLNIVESSIVVFASLKKFEKDIDLFLFLSCIELKDKHLRMLTELNVNIEKLKDETVFDGSIVWPKECFLNFSVPNILWEKGYSFGIKLDYDIIINGSLDIEKNKPQETIFSMTEHNYETIRDMVRGDYSFFKTNYNIVNWKKKATLFGNVYIDLEKYVVENFWGKYVEEYTRIIRESPSKNSNIIFADMGLFNLVLEKYSYDFERIDEKYNTCASVRHLTQYSKIDFSPNVIHFPGPKKPWKNRGVKAVSNPYFNYYRNLWWEFVKDSKLELELIDGKKNQFRKIYKSKLYKLFTKFYVKIKKKGIKKC